MFRKNLHRARGRPRKTSHGARATVSKSMRERRGDPRAPSHQCGRHHRQRPPLLPPPRAAALLPLFGNLSSDSVQLSSVAPLGRVVRVPRKLRERPAVRATPKQPLSLSFSLSLSLSLSLSRFSLGSVTPTPFPFSLTLFLSLSLSFSFSSHVVLRYFRWRNTRVVNQARERPKGERCRPSMFPFAEVHEVNGFNGLTG